MLGSACLCGCVDGVVHVEHNRPTMRVAQSGGFGSALQHVLPPQGDMPSRDIAFTVLRSNTIGRQIGEETRVNQKFERRVGCQITDWICATQIPIEGVNHRFPCRTYPLSPPLVMCDLIIAICESTTSNQVGSSVPIRALRWSRSGDTFNNGLKH
jgi:hypothetical protein